MLLLKALVASLVSLLASQGLALDLDKPIVGCEEVQCPLDNSEPRCKLQGNIFQDIGLTRIPDLPEPLKDFSILKGVNVSGPSSDLIDTITALYYLGTPQSISLDEIDGCAVIFHDAPRKQFSPTSNGTCSDIINQSCIDTIQEIATNISYTGPNCICQRLQLRLEKETTRACENVTDQGRGFGSISAIDLSKLTNIEDKQNSTSDCWPILPKSANLAAMYGESHGWDGGLKVKAAYTELHRITPILTLFIARKGGKSVVNETVSRLTCIKINSTYTGSSEEWKSAASLVTLSAVSVGSAFLGFMLML